MTLFVWVGLGGAARGLEERGIDAAAVDFDLVGGGEAAAEVAAGGLQQETSPPSERTEYLLKISRAPLTASPGM